jgi:signal peptidase I
MALQRYNCLLRKLFMEYMRSEQLPEPESAPEKKGGFRRFLVDLLETVLLSLALFMGINAISARIRIESISMQPTLYANDFVIVNKLAYKLGQPERGDVIIFRYPPDPDREPYIKRLIGLPGDQVHVSGGVVSVNDIPLREPYISAPPNYEGTWMVPQGNLFVLGDNRNSSSDSHSWGMVPLDNVIGKAEVVYWPPSEWKLLDGATAVAAQE